MKHLRPFRTLALAALLFVVAPCCLAVSIDGPAKAKRDRIVLLTAKDVPDKAGVRWRFDRTKLDARKLPDGSLLLVGPPGVYAIELETVSLGKDGTTQLDDAAFTLTIEGDAPPVVPTPPSPTPTPGPKPAPPTKAWVIVIEDTAQASAKRGTYFADPAISSYLAAKGWKWRAADVAAADASGQYPADLKPYRDRAVSSGKALPWLFVVDDKGAVRAEGTLTQTPAELATLLKEIGE